MGTGTSHAGGGKPKTGAAPSYSTAENIEKAQNAIAGLGKTRISTATFISPSDGHTIRATVEKVATRDYWGRKAGKSTYTVNVYDETADEKLYYTYGAEKLAQVKDTIRQRSGVPKK